MGKLIYLDSFRPQEPELPPFTLCGGLIMAYVVDPSVPPKTRPVIVRTSTPQEKAPAHQLVSKVSTLPVNKREEQA